MKTLKKIIAVSCLLSCNTPVFSLANPASVNCINQGNKLALIQNIGICIFPDGSYCEEWAYFRNECSKGQQSFPGGKFNPQNLNRYCLSGNKPTTVIICK